MAILLKKKKKLKGRKILQDMGSAKCGKGHINWDRAKGALSCYLDVMQVLTLCHQVLVLRHYFKQGIGELRAERLMEWTCRHRGPGEMELISAKGRREGSEWHVPGLCDEQRPVCLEWQGIKKCA